MSTTTVERLEAIYEEIDVMRAMAKQINAKTTTVPSSHVAMLTYAKEVAKVIEDAVAGAK